MTSSTRVFACPNCDKVFRGDFVCEVCGRYSLTNVAASVLAAHEYDSGRFRCWSCGHLSASDGTRWCPRCGLREAGGWRGPVIPYYGAHTTPFHYYCSGCSQGIA